MPPEQKSPDYNHGPNNDSQHSESDNWVVHRSLAQWSEFTGVALSQQSRFW